MTFAPPPNVADAASAASPPDSLDDSDAPHPGTVPLPSRDLGGFPGWLREIDWNLPVAAQFVVSGNIRDYHLVPGPDGSAQLATTLNALWLCLTQSDFEGMFVYDPVDFLQVHPETSEAAATLNEVFPPSQGQQRREVSPAGLVECVARVTSSDSHRVSLVIDYASRLSNQDGSPLGPDERHLFEAAVKFAHTASSYFRPGNRKVALYNPVVWLVEQDNDLPSWVATRNDAVRHVSVPLPDLDDRLEAAGTLAYGVPGFSAATEDERLAFVGAFAEQTEGMTLRSMVEIVQLAMDRDFGVTEAEDAVRCYRVGMFENPWKRPRLRGRIRDGEKILDIASLARSGLFGRPWTF